jgi:hypothetical protein
MLEMLKFMIFARIFSHIFFEIIRSKWWTCIHTANSDDCDETYDEDGSNDDDDGWAKDCGLVMF